MKEQLEEGQIVLCTVDKIAGTTIFVKIQNNGEGTLMTPEVSPGRIRNLRDYVSPGKKIVCKILKISGDRINLSLRRVKQSEKKELFDKIKKEKNIQAILKTALGEKTEQKIEEITSEDSLIDFFENIKKNPKILNDYFTEKESDKIIQIIKLKKEKPKEIQQIIKLSNKSPDGIKIVKEIMNQACKDSRCDISYISAGRYNFKLSGEDFKEIKSEMNKIIETIEKEAKKQNCDFEVEKK